MKMNSTKEILETVVDTQKKAINSFMETANKFQDAFKSGNGFEKTTVCPMLLMGKIISYLFILLKLQSNLC